MKSKLYYTIIALFIIVAILLLNTQNDTYRTNGEKKIYYADNISSAQNKIIILFNEEYAGRIKVIPVDLPFSKFTTNERKEIITRSLRSKNDRIDIFAVDLIWAPRFSKWSYPLDSHFDGVFLSKYMDHVIESVKYENKLIALPLYTDVGLLYFRKDLLIKAGLSEAEIEDIKYSTTWENIIKIGEKFNSTNPYYIYAGDSFEGMICSFHETISETEIYNIFHNMPINLDTPSAKRGLQLMVDLIYKYKYTPPNVLGFDENKSYQFAIENQAVFFRGWPGFYKFALDYGLRQDQIANFDIAALPHFKGDKKNGVYGGWNLMISKFSDNIDESVEFLKFTSRLEIQKILYTESGYFPAVKETYTDNTFMAQNKELVFYKELLAMGKHRPFRENYTKISDIMSYYFHQALEKKITVEEALKMASAKINSTQVFIK